MIVLASQCSVYDFRNVAPSCLVVELLADLSADIGHFDALYAVVQDVCHDVYVVYVKEALFLAFLQDTAEEDDFLLVEVLADGLHLPDGAEEIGAQRSVSENHQFDGLQMRHDKLQYLFLRGSRSSRCPRHAV